MKTVVLSFGSLPELLILESFRIVLYRLPILSFVFFPLLVLCMLSIGDAVCCLFFCCADLVFTFSVAVL